MYFKALLVGLTGLSLAAGAAAQTLAPGPEFSPQSFRSHVVFLADDLLEGRESGTRGYDIAAHYVASQFESLGLQPGAADGWFQPIDFVRYTTTGTPRLTIDGRTFTHGRDML